MVFENALMNYFSFSLKMLGCKNFQNFFFLVKKIFFHFPSTQKQKFLKIVIIFFASTTLLNYFSFNLKKLGYKNFHNTKTKSFEICYNKFFFN